MRARNIKPGFYKNENLVECSIAARLLAPGLWMLADKAGRLEDRPKQIKIEIFPCDNVDVNQLLDELSAHQHIRRYEVGGKRFIQICKFNDHQRPHSNEIESVIPNENGEFSKAKEKILSTKDESALKISEALRSDTLTTDSLIPSSLNPEEREGAQSATQFPASKKFKKKKKKASRLGEDFVPPDAWLEFAISKSLSTDESGAEWAKFRDHHLSKGTLLTDWDAGWRTWVRRAVEYRMQKQLRETRTWQ